jgi:hypothetical protein
MFAFNVSLRRYSEGVEHGINQTQAAVVICDAKLLKNLTAVAKNCPMLKYVVTMVRRCRSTERE